MTQEVKNSGIRKLFLLFSLFLFMLLLNGCFPKPPQTIPINDTIPPVTAEPTTMQVQNDTTTIPVLPNTTVTLPENKNISTTTSKDAKVLLPKKTIIEEEPVTWYYDTIWKARGTPPVCSSPLILSSPVNISIATAVLYPGQVRGNDYKPHGGFRFDNSQNNAIVVKAPLDAVVTRGSRYIEQGTVQYLFEFVNPCGIMYRFDHLTTLSPTLQNIAETFPEALPDDSRTTFTKPIIIKQGDTLATTIGASGNIFVDFGVYNLRQRNNASNDELWLEKHNTEFAPYAMCWLDLLPVEDSRTAKALPGADSTSGTSSDYCN